MSRFRRSSRSMSMKITRTMHGRRAAQPLDQGGELPETGRLRAAPRPGRRAPRGRPGVVSFCSSLATSVDRGLRLLERAAAPEAADVRDLGDEVVAVPGMWSESSAISALSTHATPPSAANSMVTATPTERARPRPTRMSWPTTGCTHEGEQDRERDRDQHAAGKVERGDARDQGGHDDHERLDRARAVRHDAGGSKRCATPRGAGTIRKCQPGREVSVVSSR